MTVIDALRLGFGTLTLLPVGRPAAVGRGTWRRAMLVAPLVGLVVGALAGGLATAVTALGGSDAVAAVGAVAALAVLTRGLHLDGLADVADGLGSGRRPDEARAVMRRSDAGPFAVVTLVLVLLVQVASLTPLVAADAAVVTVVGASVLSRAMLTWTCRTGVSAADLTGLGASVAGVVPRPAAAAVLGVALAAVALGGALLLEPSAAVSTGLAGAVALVTAELWRRHCSRRLGGVTGDVLGATEQVTWTAFVVVLSLLLL